MKKGVLPIPNPEERRGYFLDKEVGEQDAAEIFSKPFFVDSKEGFFYVRPAEGIPLEV
jgi:hypothetical protein